MTSRTQGELHIVLVPASADDLPGIEALLSGSQLPTTDVAQHLGGFILARAEGELVGTGALEWYGEVALLRSVCVAPSHRSHRVGRALLDAIESDATSQGIHHLYLLTTTAADYFARHGFATISRDQAPPAIQQTAEFRTLCPSSAICMQKALSLDGS
jgi:N-acetylglutamate synthase-like GNAT family acetyltransferase